MIRGNEFCDLPTLARDTILLETTSRPLWYRQLYQLVIKKSIQATRNIPIDTRHPEKLRYLRTFPWRFRNKNQYLLMEREPDFTH